MSSPQALPPLDETAAASAAAGLRSLPTQRGRVGGVTATVLVFGLLLGGMVGYLGLQTVLQRQAFTLNALRVDANVLSARQAYLEATLATQATPVELARAAAAAGLVANPYAAYLVVPDGQVRGVVKPVIGDELAGISTPPPANQRGVPVLPAVGAGADTAPADTAPADTAPADADADPAAPPDDAAADPADGPPGEAEGAADPNPADVADPAGGDAPPAGEEA
ncbi:MAG: hypothetical protein LBH76_05605 [Propionibacteriaceae bacterium]|jgi:hypothetical protein|nr:hypothetical protein [Propionibacteriaceae bacterium]